MKEYYTFQVRITKKAEQFCDDVINLKKSPKGWNVEDASEMIYEIGSGDYCLIVKHEGIISINELRRSLKELNSLFADVYEYEAFKKSTKDWNHLVRFLVDEEYVTLKAESYGFIVTSEQYKQL